LETLVERIVENSLRGATSQKSKDWRRTIGMFDDDPIAKEIIEGALRSREEEREAFQANAEATDRIVDKSTSRGGPQNHVHGLTSAPRRRYTHSLC
jgi:hypothetical protein